MLRTRITEEYGLDAPIICAGMAFVAMPPLAAAVSEAGGLGLLGGGLVPVPGLREMLQSMQQLTTRPYGVDFITDFVEPEHIQVRVDARVPVVVFFWALPDPDYIKQLHRAGTKVWMQVGSVAEAQQALALPFDAIVVQGSEGGGHNRAAAGTFSQIPAIAKIVAPRPVIAAGGIVDGGGLVAALALGADAVACGTRFLATEEANAHQEYKERVLKATVADTVGTKMFGPEWPDEPLRVIRNRVVDQWAGREAEIATLPASEETIGESLVAGERVAMPKFSVMLPTPDTTGDFDEMCLTAGESSGNIDTLKPAREVVSSMAAEAEAAMQRLAAATD